MKILLVAATRNEIEPFLSAHGEKEGWHFKGGLHEITALVTGVGMVATAYALGHHLAHQKYDLAINAGIAGSFDFNLNIGELVAVTKDIFAEQGAEDGEDFLSINELGFGENEYYASKFPDLKDEADLKLSQMFAELKSVNALTVNRVHGNELTIAKTLSRFNAQIESMEGAAFFYSCNKSKVPCLQIRSISNYVERRNREKWNIGQAIHNLNQYLSTLLIDN